MKIRKKNIVINVAYDFYSVYTSPYTFVDMYPRTRERVQGHVSRKSIR